MRGAFLASQPCTHFRLIYLLNPQQGLLTSTLPLIPFLYLLLHQGPEGLGFTLVRKVQSYLAVLYLPWGQQPCSAPHPQTFSSPPHTPAAAQD